MTWLALLACASVDPVELPVEEPGPLAVIELAPPGDSYGDLQDGSVVWCGIPPQGGAPYTPLMFRIWGPDAFAEGVALEMQAEDAHDAFELGYTPLTMGLVQANVGENAGAYVGAEAHLRYEGASLDELDAREVILAITATALADPTLSATHTAKVTLVLE